MFVFLVAKSLKCCVTDCTSVQSLTFLNVVKGVAE